MPEFRIVTITKHVSSTTVEAPSFEEAKRMFDNGDFDETIDNAKADWMEELESESTVYEIDE